METTQKIQNELPHWFTQKAEARLQFLYGPEKTAELMDRLIARIKAFTDKFEPLKEEHWNEQDVILIAYGDHIKQQNTKSLSTLYEFISLHLHNCINSVHVLPYFPYSSDDGFAVIDYKSVNPLLGDWSDIERISQDFHLMSDLVINHVSRENLWFIDYLNNIPPACHYFIELPPETDLTSVVRPRSTPLLVPAHTHQGVTHVWATFGEDQVDVNFANPELLFEYIDILLLYISKGSRFIRLDAVAYLWKKLGTRCINLRETHEVVKLLRDIVDVAAYGTVLITETNVPNGENLSYFGNSDEAHMIYQFTLPPLLLHAMFHGNSRFLSLWTQDMPRAQKNCTYLNFIASHDGIGLRPAEGILPPDEVLTLVDAMHQYGGYVSMRTNNEGKETPYEINIALFDALRGTQKGTDQWQVQRFICAHAIMFALQGIPAIYLHSLTATPNDQHGVEQTEHTRAINRHRWDYNDLMELLNNPRTPNAEIFFELKRLLKIRRKQAAFHPDAIQESLYINDSLVVFWRLTFNLEQRLLIIANITDKKHTLPLSELAQLHKIRIWRDLIDQTSVTVEASEISLHPYQCVWLETLT